MGLRKSPPLLVRHFYFLSLTSSIEFISIYYLSDGKPQISQDSDLN
uniref:Uncharacterized protein n=1 Tax=Myoviridae sp. ct3wi9 TaxID=2826610 RepID=A0A8S5MWZ2_9CAUD|nr:MAG TPA: hypothetical protein [Myoviridae sp. ct3wi9]